MRHFRLLLRVNSDRIHGQCWCLRRRRCFRLDSNRCCRSWRDCLRRLRRGWMRLDVGQNFRWKRCSVHWSSIQEIRPHVNRRRRLHRFHHLHCRQPRRALRQRDRKVNRRWESRHSERRVETTIWKKKKLLLQSWGMEKLYNLACLQFRLSGIFQ